MRAPDLGAKQHPGPWHALLGLVLLPFRLLGLLVDLVFLLLVMAILIGIIGFVIWLTWQVVFPG